jgi:hypothetical protein
MRFARSNGLNTLPVRCTADSEPVTPVHRPCDNSQAHESETKRRQRGQEWETPPLGKNRPKFVSGWNDESNHTSL